MVRQGRAKEIFGKRCEVKARSMSCGRINRVRIFCFQDRTMSERCFTCLEQDPEGDM